ncbi:hypothetical protein VNO78_07385 [Psophocarpus tetragonolobus]|uniref:Uncharacterized protein n=1 Tax=Psophocarpus tetragonolobus TaxID=3891 RepID=A0AAN9STC6_PSOTE
MLGLLSNLSFLDFDFNPRLFYHHNKSEVFVCKILLRTTSGGYKCCEWFQLDKVCLGPFRNVSCQDNYIKHNHFKTNPVSKNPLASETSGLTGKPPFDLSTS